MLIIEGPDGAGKTTLIKKISQYLSLPIHPKAVNSQAQVEVDLRVWVEDVLAKGFQKSLFDRFALISGPIYAPILQDEDQISLFEDVDWFNKVSAQLEAINPIIIVCLPYLETVIRNTRDDPNNEVISPWITEIYIQYQLYCAKTRPYIYNYRMEKDISRVLSHITTQLIKRDV